MAYKKWIRNGMVMSQAVTTKGVLIFLGFWGGRELDRVLETSPWIMFLGILVGFGAGLFYLFWSVNKLKG